jgi:multidrug resistance efflux pump
MSEQITTSKNEKLADSKPPMDPVRRWTFIILALVLLLLVWYLRADRVTPYSSQALVHALVIPIAPEISGTISTVSVSNNQAVNSGDELFQIDRDRYQLAVETAQAGLKSARQAQGASRASVDVARANLKAVTANKVRSEQDANRMRNIREEDPGAISMRRLESAEASLAAALGQEDAARANLEMTIQNLGDAGDQNSGIQQAQAALDQAQLNLDRSTVRAPEDGVVTGVRLDKGNFAGAGMAQMTFIATHNIWVQADFTENNLGHIKPGDEVAMVFEALPGQVIKGTVREIGFGVSVDNAPLGSLPTIQNDTDWLRSAQRYPVLIDFKLPKQRDRTGLKVGSQVSVIVYTGNHWLFNPLATFHIHLVSLLTYAF